MVQVASYGTWKSPLSSKIACDSSIAIIRMYVDPYNQDLLYWSENHPEESGATLVFSKSALHDAKVPATRLTPSGFDVYNMVHEYGGASFIVNKDTVYFTNLDGGNDNKIYSQTSTSPTPQAVTKKNKTFRYADADFSQHDDYLFCVQEDHSQTSADVEPTNIIIALNVKTGDESVVESGNNFYSTPRVSPDGTKLAWVTWNHPNMPWDDTEIWVAEFSIGPEGVVISSRKKVAGESGVNFMEPRWSPDNKLMYISDNTGWWSLYLLEDPLSGTAKCVHHEPEKEIGGPCWHFGGRSYSPNPKNSDQVVVLFGAKPGLLKLSTGEYKTFDIGKRFARSCVFQPNGENIFFDVVSFLEPGKILKFNLSSESFSDFHDSAENVVDSGYLSEPTVYKFQTVNDDPDDPNKVLVAYGYYYPPKNRDYKAPDNELPPVLVSVHGGPTSSATLSFDLKKQYFTSRGIGIFDLNYRGSTGYGTVFRKSLNLKWGVYDLTDAVEGVKYLANELKLVDKNKILISGGSAGGYTALGCLTFKNTDQERVFATGASHYGVSDLSLLAADTHKFESRYLDTMIAPYPECIEVYHERSPIYHSEKFRTPCAFFQGALDQVVPPAQSEKMFDELKNNGITCSYVLFEDEYHGFKKSENKQKALDGEFYFYSVILDFKAADTGIEIEITNPPASKK